MINDTSYHATVGIDIAKNIFQIFSTSLHMRKFKRNMKLLDFYRFLVRVSTSLKGG